MTPIQALQKLDIATSLIRLTRAEHNDIMRAIKVLGDMINIEAIAKIDPNFGIKDKQPDQS